jgi:hypothetical protein
MRRFLFLSLLLLLSSPLFAVQLSMRSEEGGTEALAVVEKAVRKAVDPLFPSEAEVAVTVTEFSRSDAYVSCSFTLAYGDKNVKESGIVVQKGWQSKLTDLFVEQLRTDILPFVSVPEGPFLSSQYRFSFATEKGDVEWEQGQHWGAMRSSSLAGVLVVSSVRKDVVVFEALSDRAVRLGEPLQRMSRWRLDAFLSYHIVPSLVGGGVSASYAWPYPFAISLGLFYRNLNLLMEGGLEMLLPLSSFSSWYFFRNSSLFANVRFGVGVHPFVIGSSATIGWRFAISPKISFAVAARKEYYATIEERSVWCDDIAIVAGIGVWW